MSNGESFRRLISARVRLVRQSDGEILNGWLLQMTASRLKLTLRGTDAGSIGEQYLVEVHGPSVRLVLSAKLVSGAGKIAEFEVGRDIKFLPVSEPARVSVDDFTVRCHWDNKEFVGHIANISCEGLCMDLPGEVMVGSLVSLEIHHQGESYKVRGDVRYCVETGDGLGIHRMGVQLLNPDDRWLGLFAQVSEAA
mgnify:CR=1 FL=1